MQQVEGYEGRKLLMPSLEEALSAVEGGTPKEKAEMKNVLDALSHYQNGAVRAAVPADLWERMRLLQDSLEDRFAAEARKKGFEMETQTEMRQRQSLFGRNIPEEKELFFLAGSLSVRAISRVSGAHIDVMPYLFDEDGSIREQEEFVRAYQERNPEPRYTWEKAGAELDDEEAGMLREFLEDMGLAIEDVKDVKEGRWVTLEVDLYNKKYEMMRNEDGCIEKARESLEDGEIWKMQVQQGSTTKGLDDWVEEVLSIDGWESELCRYDGVSHTTKGGYVYWRSD